MGNDVQTKLQEVVKLLNHTMADPEIEIEYCIPGVDTTADHCSIDSEPFILVKYFDVNNHTHERTIRLRQSLLNQEPEELANFVTFQIEEFKSGIDAGELGG